METLPHDVRHLFDVKRIGKCWAAICKACSYRCNFERMPVTAYMHGKLARHVSYHERGQASLRELALTSQRSEYDAGVP